MKMRLAKATLVFMQPPTGNKMVVKQLGAGGTNCQPSCVAEFGNDILDAITAKQAKLDKKLRMVDLQLKKARLDQQNSKNDGEKLITAADGRGVVLDRNELLRQILGEKPKD
jgi:hypothetical protein